MIPTWVWIPVTLGAAAAQTLRNAAQRHLTPVLGTLGATLVRFLYGLPFAILWCAAVLLAGDGTLPAAGGSFLGWVVVSSAAQIAATALLLRVMAERNFALGIAYSKTEVMQIAVFGLAFLGDPLTVSAILAVVLGSIGVMLLSPLDREHPLRTLLAGWTTRSALLGMASGTGFAIAAVGFRGAALSLHGAPVLVTAAWTLVIAQALQTLMLGGWLLVRDAKVVARVIAEWRRSLLAGFMGAAASACWFTAFTLESAAHVRTLGLVEIVFSYAVSRHFFREAVTRVEIAGLVLLMTSLVTITLSR